MSCECDSQCPAATQCYCIYTYDDGICVCVCDYPMVLPADAARSVKPSSTLVDLCIRNVELADLAAALDSLGEADVFIPAARARTKVSLSLRKLTIGEALEKLGLATSAGLSAPQAP